MACVRRHPLATGRAAHGTAWHLLNVRGCSGFTHGPCKPTGAQGMGWDGMSGSAWGECMYQNRQVRFSHHIYVEATGGGLLPSCPPHCSVPE
jgi:hypothetical protein